MLEFMLKIITTLLDMIESIGINKKEETH